MKAADQLAHMIKHTSQQQTEDYGPFVYGHIASYDPTLGRVRCVLPAMRDEGGNPILTGWMPLGTMMAGAGIGLQYAPLGGATVQNPTSGELVKISRFDRTTGVGHIDGFMFNTVASPPFPGMAPGELGIKATGGTFLFFHANKDFEVNSQGKTIINTVGDVEINAQGNVSLVATGSLMIQATAATIKAMGGSVHKLVTDAMVNFFNTHTHPANGDPPSQTMGDTELTTTLEAE